jgi:hypothetical protein
VIRRTFLVLLGAALTIWPAAPATPASAATALAVRVSGNRLVDGAGRTLRLLGVNRSGGEYACVQGWGIWDGPVDDTSVAAIASWHVNAVRVPLNEDCWLGINGVDPTYSGTNYRNAVSAFVGTLHAHGLYVVLDLHWNAAGTAQATGQQEMVDADHGPAFWSSVAGFFKNDAALLFDLYNEPHDVDWSCWLSGCSTPGWQTAGMQSLVDAVRGAGATQPLMLGGLAWSNDLSGWLAHEPSDPDHALVASFHNYNFNTCSTSACWDATVAPVAAQVPVVTGETGENDCTPAYITQYMNWADTHGVSYLGWTWNTWDCGGGPALISDYSGTPTAFGAGLKTHLAQLAAGLPPLPFKGAARRFAPEPAVQASP